MPKFSNLAIENGDDHVSLQNVFKDSPGSAVVKVGLSSPCDSLQGVLGAEALGSSDEVSSSSCGDLANNHAGEDQAARRAHRKRQRPLIPLVDRHCRVGDYVAPRRAQPGDVRAGKVLLEHVHVESIILPNEVTGLSEPAAGPEMHWANGTSGDLGGLAKEPALGPRWFEDIPPNKAHTELIRMTLREHEALHMLTMELKTWLTMEVPLIEDGNSFGADVQEHLIRELEAAYKKSNAYHYGSRQHWMDRTKLLTDWVKYPNLLDYPNAIAASDRMDHFLICSYLRGLVVIYAGLLTKFERNWTKVINPKGAAGGAGGMY